MPGPPPSAPPLGPSGSGPPPASPALAAPIAVTTTTTATADPGAPTALVDGGARPVPPARPSVPPPGPATAYPTTNSPAGYLATDVGCASGTSATALDAFFRERIGPVLGHDYQHVYELGGDRRLWLFQDTFIDHTGNATRLDQASFAHNTAMVQTGRCFSLLHRGTAAAPSSFEPGTGDQTLSRWFWPLGGELSGSSLGVFWAEMAKTADPRPPDGLGWVPVRTWLATYDTTTLARTSFRPAPASGVHPIYGFAVSSDADHTYLFGNSFDQNLAHQGGFHACPCSATAMYLARVPRGALGTAPEFRTADGWSTDAGAAVAIVRRFHAENPMQPRYLDGRWVAVTKVDGYWGDELAVDVAEQPWGPWSTVSRRPLAPRGGDPLMNTYHAHLLPSSGGWLVISASQNARDMLRDAWPNPARYRLQLISHVMPEPPPAATSTTTTSSTTTVPAGGTTTTIPASTTAEPTTTTEAVTTTIETTTTLPAGCATTTTATSDPSTSTAPTTSSSTTTTTTAC